jgi:hypothetical protein
LDPASSKGFGGNFRENLGENENISRKLSLLLPLLNNHCFPVSA